MRLSKYIGAFVVVGLFLLSILSTSDVIGTDINMTEMPQAWFSTGTTNVLYPDYCRLYDFNWTMMHCTLIHGTTVPSQIYTHGFNEPDPDGYLYGPTYLPSSDATIVAVWAVAVTKASNISDINCVMEYSAGISEMYFTSKGSYYFTAYKTEGWNGIGSRWTWNITSYEAWTPAMVESNSTWVSLKTTNNYGSNYLYCDYLGLYVWWTQPGGGGPGGGGQHTWEPSENDTNNFIPWNYSLGGLFNQQTVKGAIGIVGALGLTFTPVIAVWRAKNSSDGKGLGILKAIIAGSFFLGCFLAGIY